MTLRTFAVLGVITAGTLATACSQSHNPPAPFSPTAPSAQQEENASSGVRPPQPPRPDPPPSNGTCVASQAEWTIGQRASATLLERARLDAGASLARFIRPNEAITMEYHNSRLNLYLDEREVVRGAVCG